MEVLEVYIRVTVAVEVDSLVITAKNRGTTLVWDCAHPLLKGRR